jgi:hypothetical protein
LNFPQGESSYVIPYFRLDLDGKDLGWMAWIKRWVTIRDRNIKWKGIVFEERIQNQKNTQTFSIHYDGRPIKTDKMLFI